MVAPPARRDGQVRGLPGQYLGVNRCAYAAMAVRLHATREGS